MANEQEAGAIIVQLKAQIESLEKGFARAKQTIAGFGKDTQSAAGTVAKAGTRITASFTDIDRRSVQTAARLARFTQRIIALQFALSTLQQVGGGALKKFGAETAALTSGLQTFAAIATLIPNKFGLMAAGAAGALTVFAQVVQVIDELEERQARLQKGLDRNFQRASIFRGRQAAEAALDPSESARLRREIAVQREIFLQRGGQIQVKRDELSKVGSFGTPIERDVRRIELNREIDDLEKESNEAFEALQRLNGELSRTQAADSTREAIQGINAALEDTQKSTSMALSLGLVDPLVAAEQSARAAERAVQDLIAEAVAFERQTGRKSLEIGTRLSDAQAKAAEARSKADQMREVDRQAQNLGGAVAAGLADGILSGAKPMETLAGIGRNLFANMVDDLASNLQKELSSVFKAIAGEAGVGIASALTAAIGVAGALFANRKSKSSQSFAGIDSRVTDSTPLRGIVAGPSHIAVASVGEDLARVIAPVVDGIRVLASIMGKVEVNTRGGGHGGSGRGFPDVWVPTGQGA